MDMYIQHSVINKRSNISNSYFKINSEDKYYVEILKLFMLRNF
jgi:hypothetical protein